MSIYDSFVVCIVAVYMGWKVLFFLSLCLQALVICHLLICSCTFGILVVSAMSKKDISATIMELIRWNYAKKSYDQVLK